MPRYLPRATALPVFLAAVVDFLAALVLAWLLRPFYLLRDCLALRFCFPATRRGCRLLRLSDCLWGMLARLLAPSIQRGPLTLRPCFLAARRGCRLLTLIRSLPWVLHGRAFHLRRGKG